MTAVQDAVTVPARDAVAAIRAGFADGVAGRPSDPQGHDPVFYARGYSQGEKFGPKPDMRHAG